MDILSGFRFASAKVSGIVNLATLIKKSNNDKPRLFVDVTEINHNDTGTGVQRVTRSVLSNLYKMVHDFEIIEIIGKRHGAGFYDLKTGKAIKVSQGDIFFGLDLSKFLIQQNKKFLDKMFKNDVKIWFFVHDLIPILYPELMSKSFNISEFQKWVETVVNYTGIIANSKATMDSVKKWLEDNPNVPYNKELQFKYVHLGSDFNTSKNNLNNLHQNDDSTSFLMVSTVEPKKNYPQVLKAFEQLWNEDFNVKLTIVGRKGWNSDETAKMIINSKQFGKKLFWLNNGISDEELAKQYEDSNAVIIASLAEGFGLAIVEGAAYNKPIIARDLPVFKEIAGDNAFYFSGLSESDLSSKLKEWLSLYKKNEHPKPQPYLETWETCTKKICDIISLK